ncbi:YwiC-like family protein [Raineyella antarctica]|uniref:YwiC-like family protein n=1 Tax=Raineyella antarctica TaxID=1577474 RepID=UPI000B82691B|nr:YwiC-like family protein [Raineyella antarctica]
MSSVSFQPATPAPVRKQRGHHRTSGWVPNQHGAWAMVIVPWVLGTWLRFHQGRGAAYALVLGLFWLVGYFTFHATSVWLKSRRQARYRRPVLVYGAITAALGLLTWALAGVALAWWVVPFVPVLAVALALAASRHERALVGGLLTVAAACLVVLVAAYASPAEVPSSDGTAVGLALACLGYFGGTVFFVKSMIRERGNAGFLAMSVGWHVAVLAAAVVASLLTGFPWAWAVLFAILVVRSLALPLVGPMRTDGLRFTPKQLGLAEGVFSLALMVIAFTTS